MHSSNTTTSLPACTPTAKAKAKLTPTFDEVLKLSAAAPGPIKTQNSTAPRSAINHTQSLLAIKQQGIFCYLLQPPHS
jgi:hypothetical protein